MESIRGLEGIESGSKKQSIRFPCFYARNSIQTIFDQSIYAPYLRISREKATVLTNTLDGILSSNQDITSQDAWGIRYQLDQFRNVFLAELGVLPLFLVTGKAGYDTNAIINEGYKLFPASTKSKCPEAEQDMMEAGKALAFELATACAFHVFRVTEAVLKRYWRQVSDDKTQPRLKTIGSYAKELEKQHLGDKNVWEALKQLANLHRNPLIHPEVILTVEEAIVTLGIAVSVIGAMLSVIPDDPETTAITDEE